MNEYYKQKLKEGKRFEKYIKTELKKHGLYLDFYNNKKDQYNIGETKQGYEIKYDKIYKKTGNLYIEIAEKSDANNYNYIKSGIFRDDNTHTWIIGNYNEVFFFKKQKLCEIYKLSKCKFVQTTTSKGFLLDKDLINKYKYNYLSLFNGQG
jgi:hypothetical protein